MIRFLKLSRWFSVVNFLFALGIAIIVSQMVLTYRYSQLYPFEMVAGLTVGIINALTEAWINARALRPISSLPLLWGLTLNGFRFLGLIGVLFLFNWYQLGSFNPFVAVVLITYFCFMTREILTLHFRSLNELIK